jgi:hypothetical protein
VLVGLRASGSRSYVGTGANSKRLQSGMESEIFEYSDLSLAEMQIPRVTSTFLST